jgi:hypothetical protein
LIDANPEPDIRWIHRFTNDIHQEMDLSRQFNQGYLNHNNNNRRDGPIWSITQEKINASRWKTNLFIKVKHSLIIFPWARLSFYLQHIPKRFFNSNFICRAANRHGRDERSITIIQNHHHAKKHRHTTTSSTTVDLNKQYDEDKYQSSSTTRKDIYFIIKDLFIYLYSDFLSQDIDELTNRSIRLSPYLFYTFIIGLYSFVQ